MDFDVKPLDAEVGAEIVGLDLDREVDEATRKALYDVWLDAGILLFRGLGTTPERHLALSRCFGELEIHPVETIRVPGHPEVISLSSRGDQEAPVHYFDDVPIAGRIPWHSDMIYTPTPCRAGLLRMILKPSAGGETGWIDTAAAYDALPEATRRRIEGLEARFDFVEDICDMRFGRPEPLRHGREGTTVFPTFPTVIHPLVWTHPESGRKALNVSPVQLTGMFGMDDDEGDALLHELVEHTTCGRFSYVHDWDVHDMVLWDNWRTLHTALGTPPECEREVQRTTIAGGWTTGRLL